MEKEKILNQLSKLSTLREEQDINSWIFENKKELYKIHFNNLNFKWKHLAICITEYLCLKDTLHVSHLTKTMSLNVYDSLIKINRV